MSAISDAIRNQIYNNTQFYRKPIADARFVGNPLNADLINAGFAIRNLLASGNIPLIAGDGVADGSVVIASSIDPTDLMKIFYAGGVWNFQLPGTVGNRTITLDANAGIEAMAINLSAGTEGGMAFKRISAGKYTWAPFGATIPGNVTIGNGPAQAIEDINMVGDIVEQGGVGVTNIVDPSGSALIKRQLAFPNRTAAAPVGDYTSLIGDYGEEVILTNGATTGIKIPDNASIAFPVGTQLHYIVDEVAIPAGLLVTAVSAAVFTFRKGLAATLGHEFVLRKTATDAWDVWIATNQDVNSGASPTFDGANITGITGSTSSDTLIVTVRNTSGGTLVKGTPVYDTGFHAGSGFATVSAADSSSSATMSAIGLITADILNNANGTVTVVGDLSGEDTSAWSATDDLYVSETPGVTLGLTNVKPT